jgi:DNA-binding NtrC family response regulator
VNEHRNQAKTIVVAIASQEDQRRLHKTFGFPEWKVQVVRNLQGLSKAVTTCSCCVVITDTRLPDGTWKDVLGSLEGLWNRPQVIVADRLASEALWAEVLNLGAYDLLALPFEPTEIQCVVSRAWEFSLRETARARDRALRETLITRISSVAVRGFAASA